MTIADRFWQKVNRIDGGCWLWTASLTRGGYGQFRINGKTRRAHRIAYLLSVGPIPDGLDLDHLCRTPACVNPAHLEPVTRGENTARGGAIAAMRAARAAQTHCKHGHEFTPENTYIHPKSGARDCRKCRNAAGRRARERKNHVA